MKLIDLDTISFNDKNYVTKDVLYNMPVHNCEWKPIIIRKPTEEEIEYYFENHGIIPEYWIDCELPEDGQEVLISSCGNVYTDTFDTDWNNFEYNDIDNCDAWMPLPQPYKR